MAWSDIFRWASLTVKGALTVPVYQDNGGNPQIVTPSTPLPVSVGSSPPVPSGTPALAGTLTITTGGTAQTLFAANASRKYLRIQNPITATEPLYFADTGANASATGWVLNPGDTYETSNFVSVALISIYAATTGHAFIAEQA